MSKTVFITKVKGGFTVERAGHSDEESVHIELPDALVAASDILQPQDDKPGLPELQRKILMSIDDESGCVIQLKSYWRYIAIKGQRDLGESRTCCE